MKTCSRCRRIFPGPFYRDGSWCDDCRREDRSEYKAENPEATAAMKRITEARRAKCRTDPNAYVQLHCAHIARYCHRAIDRFEDLTGKECPPELTAIRQLANRLADEKSRHIAMRGLVQKGSRVRSKPDTNRVCSECGAMLKDRQRVVCATNRCRDARRKRLNPEKYAAREAAKVARRRERRREMAAGRA